MDFTQDFFNKILDFGEDWQITNVEVDHSIHHIYLDLKYISDVYEDPDTLESAILYDHAEVRQWRHLDIFHYQSYIRCRLPRVKSPEGKVKRIAIGWADKFSRHTYLFECKVISLLLATRNQTKTAEFLQCGFKLINNVLHRSSQRGMQRRNYSDFTFEHLSIDEKAFRKGHTYATILSHPKSGAVLDLCEGRDKHSVNHLFEALFTSEQRKAVNTVSMDMWKAYINSVTECLPQAEIVHDKYHLIAYLNKCIDKIRRREVKDFDELKHSRYALLKNEANLTSKQREKYELIKASNYDVSVAWRARENFKSLFGVYTEPTCASGILNEWIQDSYQQAITELTDIAQMFARHSRGVTNALSTNINNAMAERLNGKIQELKSIGKGYRTFKNFRSAVLFFYGGLDLYPLRWA